MKKVYNLMYVVNILLGLLLSFTYLFIINYKLINILFFVLMCIIYIALSYRFFRHKVAIDKLDIVILHIYLFTIMGMFIFNVLYQTLFNSYSFIYFNFYIFIIHIIYSIYNIFR